MTTSARIEDFRHGRVPRALRQRQLVELAEQAFSERGYARTSMDELARRAGVTKPVIYELFGSKDGLFRACVDRAIEQLGASIAEAVRAETEPEDRLRAGGLAFLRFARDNRVAWDLMALQGRFAEQAQAARRDQAQLIRTLMQEIAPADADPKELEAVAYAVNSAYEGAAHWMWEHPDVPVEQVAEWIVALLLPGLRRFA
ncbi:MAG TPA: TetR/AcrR family transcriptional regulator [Thermoleophilaceae bacterium]|nr:TetR/AcrR family transcriptional regulator [Thermoleophilaceae bacterium]